VKNLTRGLSVFFAASTWAALSSAQTANGFAVDRYLPSERGSDWFVTDSLDFRGSGRLALGVVGDWAHRPLVIYNANGDLARAIVADQLNVHLGGALIIGERLRLAVNLPIQAVNSGKPGTVGGVLYSNDTGAAVGDLRVSADVRLLGEYGDAFTTALGVQAYLPTGSRSAYASDGKVRLIPHWLVAGDIGPFAYAAVVGLNGRFQSDNYAGAAFGSELLLAASAGIRFADKRVLLGPELSTSTVVSDSGNGFFKRQGTPVELLFGAHVRAGDFQFGAGFGPGLTRGLGTPETRTLASIVWFPEPQKEAPPPPVTDRDGDGIGDAVDACPDTPGVKDDDPKKNGCPKDRDGDGIIDDNDACPDEPGVESKDPKLNGCPLPKDRDHDTILDDDDACPDEPGVPSDDPKKNGCPKPKDTDGDGITDDLDACVNDPGPANDDPKKNGCPKAIVVAGEVKILERIEFDNNKATLRPESEDVLRAVADTLTKHTEIKLIQVQGHTDNRGAKDYNKRLSDKRAEAVKQWLIKAGIESARLQSKGFGQEKPIDTNETDSGRQNNRRVQFIILQSDTSNVEAK
jgi:outer membrane protein OmpA-like peptidoglycan-associated protein